jgi:FkbM family methyltransferase
MLKLFIALFRLFPLQKRKALIEAGFSSLPEPERWQAGRFSTKFYFAHLQRQGLRVKTLIDVGAFEGEWTLGMRLVFPDATCFCVEPLHEKANILRAKFSAADVTIFEHLVGAQNASAIPFYVLESGSSALPELSGNHDAPRLLDMTTLDALFSAGNIERPCLLKLDVQGFELEVLKGAGHLLTSVDLIQLELSWLNYNEQAPLVGDVLPVLQQLGFVPFDMPGLHRRADSWALIQCDMVFCRPDFLLRQAANDFVRPFKVVSF